MEQEPPQPAGVSGAKEDVGEGAEPTYWWHALDATGHDLFVQGSPDFGKPTSETTGQELQGKRCIRCQPTFEGIAPWLSISVAVLRIDASAVAQNEYFVWPRTGDIHVLGEAALRAGEARLLGQE
jgi:hypothetical protein